MIHTAIAVRTLQAVAMSVALALLLWGTGLPAFFRTAEAASITNASDTLTNSAPSSVSDHTIAFTTPNGLSAGQTIVLTFDAQFDLGFIGEDDVDIDINGSASTTAATADATNWGVATTSTTVTLTSPSGSTVASSSAVTIRIGTNAVDSGTGANQITNPSATSSYPITIGGTMQDSGEIRVAIIDEVTVSANVDTTLEFSVAGVAGGQSVNGTTTTGASTNVSIPFGTLESDSIETLAHDLSITTNAVNGYSITVEQTGPLQSTTGATIDGFINGSDTSVPTLWQGPGNVASNTDSYGHWGLTSSDADLFGSNLWVAPSTTPVTVFSHNGVVNASSTRVGYQVEIGPLQEAGDDYTTTLRYIATPTF